MAATSTPPPCAAASTGKRSRPLAGGRSGRFQDETDPHGIERKDEPSLVGFLQDADGKKNVSVSVYGLDVTLDPAGCLAQGHRAGTRHCREQLPSLLRQHPEEQRRCLEADERSLMLPLEGAQQAAVRLLA